MDATLTPAAGLPAIPLRASGARRLLRVLSALAYAAAERLTLPQRDVPPDFYRFPPL